MAKRKMIPTPADNIAKQIMETYQPQDAQEIQDVVKRIFAPIFEAALKGERQNHLGYAAHEHTDSGGSICNGYSEKTLKVPEGLGGPFRGCRRMAEQLHACRATVFLRQRRAQGHVYDERHRERERRLSQGHEEGSFPNEDAVFKLLYLRVQELYQKWAGRRIPNWALVRNQLLMDERMAKRMEQYDTTY